MLKMCVYVLFPSSTSSTYIGLHSNDTILRKVWQKCVCMFFSHLWHLRYALTYIGFDGIFGKLSVSAFQNFFQIENPLSIKEVMSQNVCVCSFPIFDIFDIHSLTPLMCTLSIFNIFDIALIFCTVFNAFNAMYLNTSNIKQCALTHIGTCPLMYTQQIRWQWVWMSGFLTI